MKTEDYMKIALAEARKAADCGEVPVGAVLVRDGLILAQAHNAPVTDADPYAHAELLTIRRACAKKGNYRLPGDELYVTLEPCVMYAGGIL